MSAITPTPAGEGKTTTSIGLADGLSRVGESVCVALREASLGPCMGVKGGATGGGRSTLHPAERINLHFTGDFHAVTTAHNLLAALVDNHLHFASPVGLDARRVTWRRVMDMNDRSLRNLVVGLGGPQQGMPRETGFDITAASEVMAMLCLATGVDDLRARLERTLVGFTHDGAPVTAGQLKAAGAMLALLHDALRPNLVQTLEGTPALVHGGPFANIAHGCNSVLATRLGLHLADWVITEAGFGFDLGAEKFFDIKCAGAGLDTGRRRAGGDRARAQDARRRRARRPGDAEPRGGAARRCRTCRSTSRASVTSANSRWWPSTASRPMPTPRSTWSANAAPRSTCRSRCRITMPAAAPAPPSWPGSS